MPRPLPGMVSVAEFGTRFAADLASARLLDFGIENAVLGDPASSIAPHHVTERWFSVCVRAEAVEDAREVLADEPADHGHHDGLDVGPRHFRDRPRWIRLLTWALIIAVPVPIVISLLLLVTLAMRSLFP